MALGSVVRFCCITFLAIIIYVQARNFRSRYPKRVKLIIRQRYFHNFKATASRNEPTNAYDISVTLLTIAVILIAVFATLLKQKTSYLLFNFEINNNMSSQ